ncbi:hypothetical protein CHRY9390_01323 [Chryseobacterium aquaeductus]|uniref:Uncharacterized protein n=1 Tax=Chryseobacterium aquaeductus TaxID=2675056 RepID=A0A9N8MMP3_9FLAO|nr:four helix bundle protein [Chryseobacterium aquaeductus]CAA7330652.1 hypothetical protein CHRY9390_01323 [Chryseobacterium potabilaquae]CAD7805134.1 hypothetical protein CHRY9390_01323 [Chryseobacterium aquaeductus]
MTLSFENFPIYKKAISFTVKIFKILENENLQREFSLKDQLKRATLLSITIILQNAQNMAVINNLSDFFG